MQVRSCVAKSVQKSAHFADNLTQRLADMHEYIDGQLVGGAKSGPLLRPYLYLYLYLYLSIYLSIYLACLLAACLLACLVACLLSGLAWLGLA